MSGGWFDEYQAPKTEEEKNEEVSLARNESNKEFIHLLKEKDALKAAADEKQRELNTVKGRNYELLQKNEQLEKELADLKAEKKADKDAKKAAAGPSPHNGANATNPRPGHKPRPKTAKHPNPRQKAKKGITSKSNAAAAAAAAKKVAEVDKAALEKDTYFYYAEIAERYPMLRLSVLLEAEKKFVQADVNGDGTIDADELEKILETSSLLFTKQQVMDIVNEIDKDGSNDLDFIECLAVIDRLQQNKKTKLPTSLEQSKSSVCLIQ